MADAEFGHARATELLRDHTHRTVRQNESWNDFFQLNQIHIAVF